MEIDIMKWLWRRKEKLCEPRIGANSELMELETAKEILAEVFHARPADVEEMIQSRLEEARSLPDMENIWLDEREEGRWTVAFCLEE